MLLLLIAACVYHRAGSVTVSSSQVFFEAEYNTLDILVDGTSGNAINAISFPNLTSVVGNIRITTQNQPDVGTLSFPNLSRIGGTLSIDWSGGRLDDLELPQLSFVRTIDFSLDNDSLFFSSGICHIGGDSGVELDVEYEIKLNMNGGRFTSALSFPTLYHVHDIIIVVGNGANLDGITFGSPSQSVLEFVRNIDITVSSSGRGANIQLYGAASSCAQINRFTHRPSPGTFSSIVISNADLTSSTSIIEGMGTFSLTWNGGNVGSTAALLSLSRQCPLLTKCDKHREFVRAPARTDDVQCQVFSSCSVFTEYEAMAPTLSSGMICLSC